MEYEIKFKLDKKKDITHRLRQLGAQDLGRKKETDIYLTLNNQAVRIRRIGKEGLITIKKFMPTKKRVKVRQEIQTKVEDTRALIEIFKLCGFREFRKIEKSRHTFKLDQGLVLIDRLPFMGYFVEIEAASFKRMKNIAKIIGLDYNKGIISSYLNLFFSYIIKNVKKFKNSKTDVLPLFAREEAFSKKNRRELNG